jgi:hypothetical protein
VGRGDRRHRPDQRRRGGCLENANNATTVNNPLQLDTCGTNAGQQWSRYSDGTLRVQGLCADLLNGATASNTRVVLAACSTTSTFQRWTLYAAGYVQNQKFGTCLAPLNNQVYAKVAVVVATCANVAAHHPVEERGDGSPPLEISVGKGTLNLEGGYGYPGAPRTFSQVVGPATTGQRTDLVLHVFFSRDPAKGSVDVWRNGAAAIAGYRPAGGTLYPTDVTSTDSLPSYWKMGIYRDSAITQQAQYTIEEARVGNTRTQVGG